MMYFIVLPVFLLTILVQFVLIAASFVFSGVRWSRPYLWSVLLWSTTGFVAANLVLVVVIVLVFGAVGLAASPPNSVASKGAGFLGALLAGGLLIGGPFVASAAGMTAGGLFGLWRVRRAKLRVARTQVT
jgi:hypothetical protein